MSSFSQTFLFFTLAASISRLKKVPLLKTHLNLLCPVGLSGPPDSWAGRVDCPLPCDGGYFLYYQQRMSFSTGDFILYH